jgi:hypothetical protein
MGSSNRSVVEFGGVLAQAGKPEIREQSIRFGVYRDGPQEAEEFKAERRHDLICAAHRHHFHERRVKLVSTQAEDRAMRRRNLSAVLGPGFSGSDKLPLP